MKKYLIALLAILPFWAGANSFTIKKLGIEQGLSNNNINGIVQDRNGIMWIGTRSGLNRFDGSRFKVFKHSTLVENSINSNELNPIFADKHDNIIWIATERNGVNAYNYDENKFTYYTSDNSKNCISSNGVTCISDDKEGNIWFATYNAGVDYLNKKTGLFTHYNQSNVKGLGSNYNWCAVDDHNGHLYVGHVSSGLSVINLKNRRAINFINNPQDPNSIPNNFVSCIFIDSKDRVWVGTNMGLALFNPRLGTFKIFRKDPENQNSISGNVILSITEVNKNTLWVGTSTGGVSILNYEDEIFNTPEKVSFQHIPVMDNPNGLSNAYISAIKQDSYGNIWIGTAGGGLNFIQNKPDFFNKISYLPIDGNTASLSNKLVSGLCIDQSGNLWIGTEEKGIDLFRNNVKVRNFNQQNSIVSDNISCAFTDSEHNLWFGTVDGEILICNSSINKFSVIPDFKPIGARIRYLYEDSKKNIWVCSDNGLYSYNLKSREQKSIHLEDHTGLTDNVVRSVVEDSNGNLWIGTLGGGICVFNSAYKRIHYYPPGDVIYGINHIYKDSKKRIWICSRYNLLLFKSCNDTVYEKFGLEDGFADNYFHAITEGATANDIWVSTTNGISYLDVLHKKVHNFNKLDGIPLGDYMNATVTKSADGTIYFGSQNGVCLFNAHMAITELKLPEIVISNFSVADKKYAYSGDLIDIPVKGTIELNHNQNTFSVSFNIPDYSLNEKVEFSYQLKGLDDNWFNVLNNKELTFRNLRPGTYMLNIKSRLRNHEWPDNYHRLTIVINPPFWFSWWAKLIYAIILIVTAYYLTRFYKRKLDLENSLYLEKKNHLQENELNDERLRFFTNITHELRTPLTLIIGPLEDLVADATLQPQQFKKINSIHRSAKRLLDLINQILEFRKSETRNRRLSVRKGNIALLAHEIGLKYKELNQNTKIDFRIKLPAEPLEIYFDTEVITIILDNLISNALKYTVKGKVTLELRSQTIDNVTFTEIVVADTGFGIPTEALPRIFDRYYQVKGKHQMSGTGIGLALVKNMVDLHEGNIFVDSVPNKGTTFTIQLQAGNTYPDALHAEQKSTDAEVELIHQASSHQLILVVEDNAEINEYIRDCFTGSYEVLVAENGKAGLDIAVDKIPDIIISDIMMPVMDGIELCKKLKEDVRTCHIPIILLTAKDSLQDKTEGYSVGADSYLTKPFSGNLLRSRVNNLLETRKKIAQLFSSAIVSKQSIVQESISKLDNEFIDKLTHFIEENIEIEQLNIAQIADQMNMSHSTLYRKIKTLTGLSANEFIRKIRMRNAEKLLLSCKYSIAEIIYKVGISTPAYFRQCFKEEFGVTPTEYMKNVMSEND
jgi:signal transduction histidine kinase/ligand-binding sensor domain-containing protein/DNA-binding response OmpR family regulator